ncbi:MAG: Ig-like domain-containing protein [Rikenellaceae bacterium]
MKKNLQLALLAALFAGCSNDGDLICGDTPSSGVAVSFSSDLSTRVDGTAWGETDQIGIFATDDDGKTIATNVGYGFADAEAAASGELSVIAGQDPIFYYGDSSSVDYYAYYPYDAELSGESIAVDLESGDNCDILWTSALNMGASAVSFAFEHQMARLEFSIYYEADAVSSVTLEGLKSQAVFGVTAGAFSSVESVKSIAAQSSSSSDNTYTFYSTIFTSDNISSDFVVVVETEDGKKFGWAPTVATSWEGGDTYKYDINLISVAVTLTDADTTKTIDTEDYSTVQLEATISPVGRTIIWSSSKEEVATVSQEGLVTAVGVGETTITATADNCIAPQTLTVKVVELQKITISQTDDMTSMVAGESVTLTATPKLATSSTIVWSVDNDKVSVVDGVVTAESDATGSVTVTATVDGVSDSYTLTIGELKILLEPTSKTLVADGSSFTIEATTNSTKDITWASSNSSYAKVVKGDDGVVTVTAVAAGSANITATIGTVVAICAVTVEAATIEVGEDVSMSEVDSKTFTVSTNSSNSIKWSSSLESVATINDYGVVTVVAAGETTITAKIDGTEVSDSCKLTITEADPVMTLTTTSISSLAIGGTTQIEASVAPSRYTLTYTSGDDDIATVDEYGVVTGVAAGETTITVSVTGEGDTYDKTVSVKVIYEKTSETLMLADFANGYLPATSDIWIINDVEGTNFDDLHAAIKAADTAGREIEIEFPNLTTDLANNAFYCTNESLVSITFGAVATVGNNVFRDCKALKSVYLPSATKLGNKIFWNAPVTYCEVATAEGVTLDTISATTFDNGTFTSSDCTIRIGAYNSSKITVDTVNNTVTYSTTTYQFDEVLIGAAE